MIQLKSTLDLKVSEPNVEVRCKRSLHSAEPQLLGWVGSPHHAIFILARSTKLPSRTQRGHSHLQEIGGKEPGSSLANFNHPHMKFPETVTYSARLTVLPVQLARREELVFI